jgi:diaminopimelate epimerase
MTPSVRVVPFVKANACGNDFLIIDGVYVPADVAAFASASATVITGWSGRRRVAVSRSGRGHARQLFNADGSEAEISGNGTRCCGCLPLLGAGRREFTIRTGAGIKNCELISRSESRYEFEPPWASRRLEKRSQSAFHLVKCAASQSPWEPALRHLCKAVCSGMAGRGRRGRAS